MVERSTKMIETTYSLELDKQQYRTIINTLNQRLWSYSNTVNIDDTEKQEFVNLIVTYAYFARKLCKTKERFREYLKQTLHTIAEHEPQTEDTITIPKMVII